MGETSSPSLSIPTVASELPQTHSGIFTHVPPHNKVSGFHCLHGELCCSVSSQMFTGGNNRGDTQTRHRRTDALTDRCSRLMLVLCYLKKSFFNMFSVWIFPRGWSFCTSYITERCTDTSGAFCTESSWETVKKKGKNWGESLQNMEGRRSADVCLTGAVLHGDHPPFGA